MTTDTIDWLVPVKGVTYELGPLTAEQVGEIETLLCEGALIPIGYPVVNGQILAGPEADNA